MISIDGKVLPITVHSVKVNHRQKGFKVHLIIDHGDEIRADIICTSQPDGSLQIAEKLTALKDCRTDLIRTLSFGILNNPQWIYEKGERDLRIANAHHRVRAACGKHYQAQSRNAGLDHLTFSLEKQATITYQAADKMAASRYTDMLVLNAMEGEYRWKRGDLVAENKVDITIK